MPAKNALKPYINQGYYHIYNRGVEKRKIFIDEQDYKVFLYYLKLYLLPKEINFEEIKQKKDLSVEAQDRKIAELFLMRNFYDKIQLLCYALMPNHFHLLIRQNDKKDMEIFMQSLITKFVKYFNKRYKRVGPLFQSRYKGKLIEQEEYFLHLSRYIHRNPLEILPKNEKLLEYQWSSYPAYVKGYRQDWLRKENILSYFTKASGLGFSSYQGFVEGYQEELEDKKILYQELIID